MSKPIVLDLELEGFTADFIAEQKGIDEATGEMELVPGDEIVVIGFKPLVVRKDELSALLAQVKGWVLSVEVRR